MSTPVTYDPSKCLLMFDSADIDGFADGTGIEIERNVEIVKVKVGLQGQITRTIVKDQTARVTIRLAPGVPANKRLSALAKLDQSKGLGVRALYFEDRSTGTIAKGPHAWVEKYPKATHADDSSEREWVIFVAECDFIVG